MSLNGIVIRHLEFSGAQVRPVTLSFDEGLNLIYGASNTGKSFALDALNFMLGGSKPLEDIPEINGYEKVWLGFYLTNKGEYTLSRSISGGAFDLYEGLVESTETVTATETLEPTQNLKSKKRSVSQLLLEHLNLYGREVVKNKYGKKNNLSFRDLALYCLVNEENILSKASPVMSGQRDAKTKEKRIFRLVLTGLDDSSISSVTADETFSTSKAAKIEFLKEMIEGVENELHSKFPDIDDLLIQSEKLSAELDKAQVEYNEVQTSVQDLVHQKHKLSVRIPQIAQRISEINIHLNRFEQLDNVYQSDIKRLESLEEAGFLLSLEARSCTLCGTPASSQSLDNVSNDIVIFRESAIAEIKKIKHQQAELAITVQELVSEREKLEAFFEDLTIRLKKTEARIEQYAPSINQTQHSIKDVIEAHDHVKKGLALLNQKQKFTLKLSELNQLQAPSKVGLPNLTLPTSVVHEFCSVVTDVLNEWGFPGANSVTFDEEKYDIVVDGKLRTGNGKGVRAVIHAAFKVALLIYCHNKRIPHPKFIVLDSPLLTYRDPLKSPKLGELAEDELALKQTNVKEKFFDHLSSLSSIGQFIILENIDPPKGIEGIAHVEVFYGLGSQGRSGLLPS